MVEKRAIAETIVKLEQANVKASLLSHPSFGKGIVELPKELVDKVIKMLYDYIGLRDECGRELPL